MRLGQRAFAAILCAGLLAGGLAACGVDKNDRNVAEGEPVEIGDLKINVQLTRFLNPNDLEDHEYLQGHPVPPPVGDSYLAVFMEVNNESDHPVTLPSTGEVKIIDTTGAVFRPLPAENIFALPLGDQMDPHGELPAPDTAAAAGPTQGSIVLFQLNRAAPENRPLELEIDSGGETGTIELDI
jgi:hypothetical protein